ncbi:MAG: isochorismatase family cysteine hydrolase [Pseudomonadota bacterium]
MTRVALLVVDMLHDFLDPQGALYCGDAAREIIPHARALIEDYRARGGIIIFVSDRHEPDDAEFKLFPPHCVAGTRGAETIPEMEIRAGDRHLVKHRYSAFFKTPLEDILLEEAIGEVHLCGVCTSICVMETASDLRNREYPTVVHRRAVGDFDPEAQAFALKRMEKILGVKVTD